MPNEFGEREEIENDGVVPPRPETSHTADPYSVPRPGPSLNTPPVYPGTTPPPANPYGVQGGWGDAPVYRPTSGLAVAGFVVSLVSIFGVPVGLVGLILSIVGLVQVNRRNLGGKVLAIIGICVGALTTLIGAVLILIFLAVGVSCANNPDAYTDSQGTYHCGTNNNYNDYGNMGQLTLYSLR